MHIEQRHPLPAIQHYFAGGSALLPGLLLTAALTAVAMWAAAMPWFANLGLSALTLAILFGIVIGNTVYPWVQPQSHSGVQFAKQRLLRLGIILYGFRLTFQQIADVGIAGIVIDLLTLSSTFLLAYWAGRRWFGMDQQTVMLIGAGSSICGAAAVMATEPVLKADASKVSVAVATVVVFGTLAIFVYPWLYQLNLEHHWLTVSAESFGIFTGSTVHEVAQVVAAAHPIGPEAENAAVITKMLRVMMLAPFLVIISAWLSRQRSTDKVATGKPGAITIPWFALIFILVAGLNSFHLLPQVWVKQLIALDTLLLAMAMAALGLTTHISAIRQAGLKPILLASLLFAWLLIGGGAINHLVGNWIG